MLKRASWDIGKLPQSVVRSQFIPVMPAGAGAINTLISANILSAEITNIEIAPVFVIPKLNSLAWWPWGGSIPPQARFNNQPKGTETMKHTPMKPTLGDGIYQLDCGCEVDISPSKPTFLFCHTHAAAPDLLEAAVMLTKEPLGDFIYNIRDQELKGWDGPRVKNWSEAVIKIEAAIAEARPLSPPCSVCGAPEDIHDSNCAAVNP